ncbi:MAG TPA: hypothetical protein VMU95_41245 [Trebonia sp.]|nr:hypothetical protein [Trebonia sp.]
MAGFDIPEAMGTLYDLFRAADWKQPSSEPDEWVSWDGLFEVQISHSSQMCTIRWRRAIPQLEAAADRPRESAQAYLARKREMGWAVSRFKPHGQAATPFVQWLGTVFGEIVVWCTQMAEVVDAPSRDE